MGAMEDLMSGGAPSAKFAKIGDTVEGVVLSLEKRQDQDMDSGKPKTWENGDPMWVYVIEVQTAERTNPDDDGTRRIWARNKLINAVREAFRAAGLKGADSPVGGTLKVRYDADGDPPKRGWSGPKLFRAKFTPAPPKSDSWEEEPAGQSSQNSGDDDIPF